MQSSNHILDNFVPYKSIIKDWYGALDSEFKEWDVESIKKGILEAAMRGIAELLSCDGEPFPEPTHIGGIGITFEKPFIVNGIRCKLAGYCGTDASIPQTFHSEVLNASRESICLCVLSSIRQQLWPIDIEDPYTGAASLIPIYPADVNAISRGDISIMQLVDFKLYRRLFLHYPDRETVYSVRLYADYLKLADQQDGIVPQPLEELLQHLPEDHRTWVDHPLTERVLRTIKTGRNCLLVGASSSGKSVLALQVGKSLMLGGQKIRYFNLSPVRGFAPKLIKEILWSSENSAFQLFIVDDLQSNPSLAYYFLTIVATAQRVSVNPAVSSLALSWIDFAKEAATWQEDCLPLLVKPEQVRVQIIDQFSDFVNKQDIEYFKNRLGDDLLLFKLCLSESRKLKKRASLREVAERIWNDRIIVADLNREEAERVTLVACSLGRYDIAASMVFLIHEANATEITIGKLTSGGMLRQYGESFVVGHRSLCGLLADWLSYGGGWRSLGGFHGPQNTNAVMRDYLRSLGPSLAIDSLRALQARAGFKEKSKLNRRAAAIVEIWQTFNALVERIEYRQDADPTWGNDMASAMFAMQTFYEIGKPHLGNPSLSFFRSHWKIDKESLKLDLNGLRTTEDFFAIHQKMIEEDETLGSKIPKTWEPADQLNPVRFHRMWLMGLILCAESTTNKPLVPLERLATIVERELIKGKGFYPTRVPWCTARIIIGLAACGRTVDNSPVVKKAVNWLLTDRSMGGACYNGLWESGTGTWNTRLETTGMVLLAIASSGFDIDDERLASAKSFLMAERPYWTAPERELDGTQAIHAYLETGGEWQEIAQEVQRLSQWARSEAFWERATLSAQAELEQSCLVAQIVWYLINIGWKAIKSDLPAFLDALALPSYFDLDVADRGVPLTDSPPMPQTASIEVPKYDEAVDRAFQCLAKIQEISLPKCTVVGSYRRYDQRLRNSLLDWKMRIVSPLLASTNIHENFLIWAAPGSGKSFFVQEIGRSLGNKIDFIDLNLAKMSQVEFVEGLSRLSKLGKAFLCMIDEVDARSDQNWPLEVAFAAMDLNLDPTRSAVMVLVGSSGAGLQALSRSLTLRSKGTDLLDRIPMDRRFEIPAMMLEDRLVIFASNVLESAVASGHTVSSIEKLALYFVLKNDEYNSPRQLRNLAAAAVGRMNADEFRLKYDDLFFKGDRANQLFWVKYQSVASDISNQYISLVD